MNSRSQDTYTQAYNRWVVDQTPENMAALVSAFAPTINSEIQQYSGSRELLRSRAKAYVINAIRSYDPMGNTKLNSWVVTNLRQLSRYGKHLRPIRSSEEVIRNSAELNSVTKELEDKLGRKPTDEELQDETGWSVKMINKLRNSSPPVANTSGFHTDDDNQGTGDPSVGKMDDLPFLRDSVYNSLNDTDRIIFDHKLGLHGKEQLSGKAIAERLGVTPAYVSQRGSLIGSMISRLGRNG